MASPKKKDIPMPKGANRFFTDDSAIRGQGARWSHDTAEVGDTLVGRLLSSRPVKFPDGKEGLALVFSPAIVSGAKDGDVTAHRSIETLYSAGLEQKIIPEGDRGVTFAIRYDGREASQHKGRNPFKVFTVSVVDPAVLVDELRACEEPGLAALLDSATA